MTQFFIHLFFLYLFLFLLFHLEQLVEVGDSFDEVNQLGCTNQLTCFMVIRDLTIILAFTFSWADFFYSFRALFYIIFASFTWTTRMTMPPGVKCGVIDSTNDWGAPHVKRFNIGGSLVKRVHLRPNTYKAWPHTSFRRYRHRGYNPASSGLIRPHWWIWLVMNQFAPPSISLSSNL